MLGIGCRGLFYQPDTYLRRKSVAQSTRRRILRNLGIHVDLPLCRIQVTIVQRKERDGRAFDAGDVERLTGLIYHTFAIPTKVVYLEDLTVENQVRLVHETGVLICMDGSALDLLPLAREQTAVIVLVPHDRAYGHWRLLQSVGSVDRHYIIRVRQHGQLYRLPLSAIRAGIEKSLISLQNLFQDEICKHWWYFSSSELWAADPEISKPRRDGWSAEASSALGLNSSLSCPDYWPEPFDRNGMLQVLQRTIGARRILEIGCTANSFERFTQGGEIVDDYICVDPLSGQGQYKTTSDAFFANGTSQRFDLIFIDGLHTSTQAMRDIEHSLEVLSWNGVIAVHDSNPRHRIESESTYYGKANCIVSLFQCILWCNQEQTAGTVTCGERLRDCVGQVQSLT